jgi:hypothetical protein
MLKAAAMGAVSLGLTAGAGIAATRVAAHDDGDYTETYRGRLIRITEHDSVHIDGRRLHLTKLGEGAYLSAMCHYELRSTPLAAARQAVDQLRGANLLPTGH